ncbi:Scarecrow-like protein 9 [Bienertia sinuspersici]
MVMLYSILKEEVNQEDSVITVTEHRIQVMILQRARRSDHKELVIDLRGLLARCAQCIAQVELSYAYDMLKQIRRHSSPYEDFLQRVAHYLANGLEARLEGKGMQLSHANVETSASEVLKANRIFIAAVPFQIMSYYTMNKTIARLLKKHQNLSKRPNGPPRIRITGVDFPQRGFRPSERVEETGRCLAKYCEKYNVPFEYCTISKTWEDNIDVKEISPRDAYLKLVREINPDMFMHTVVNNTSSVPFFLNRFKEAMFHYSSLFDIFESTLSREDNERMLLESMIYGDEALNVIACEGVERV